MQRNVSQSNAMRIPVLHKQLKAFIIAMYPELRNVTVRKRFRAIEIRARYKKRQLCGFAYDPHRAAIRFFEELDRKVFLEPYIEA
jgi:hypothetical protein